MPVPQTIANELAEKLELLLSLRHYLEANHPDVLSLEQEAKKLAKVSPAEGYVMLAAISSICGNVGQAQSRFLIAKNQGLSTVQVMNHVTSLCRLGLFTEAGKLIVPYVGVSNELLLVTSRAMLSMRFAQTAILFNRVKSLSLEISEDDRAAFMLAEEAAKAMETAQITDEMMCELNEIAGQIMREHGVCREPECGLTIYEGDDGLPCFCGTFNLSVSYDQASEMNMELAERYSQSDISISPARYSIRFAGGYEHNA